MGKTGSSSRGRGVRAVVTELERCPEGRALAGQLEERLAAQGISRRQARRWMGWALAGPAAAVTKAGKGADGTWYSVRAAAPGAAPPVPALPAVPAEFRRDVALLVRALGQLGGQADPRAAARQIAEETGRSLVWSTAVVDVAQQAGRAVVAQGKATSEWPPVTLKEGVEPAAFEAWLAAHRFGLPKDPAALDAVVQARLGSLTELAPGEADVVAALTRLGGSATTEELAEQPFRDRRAAIGVVLRLRISLPAWAVWESSRRRVRLVAALWT